jgi:hypothetical protein
MMVYKLLDGKQWWFMGILRKKIAKLKGGN